MPEDIMLQEAIGAIRGGETARARDLLTRLIKTNSSRPEYWVWMSSVVESSKERVYCLQEALRRDPGNASARRGLVMLGAFPPAEMPAAAGLIRRNWQSRLMEADKTGGQRLTRGSVLFLAAWALAGIVLVLLAAALVMGARGPMASLFSRPRSMATLRPTATLLDTNTPVVRSATPTFAGPTPLWMYLKETYTPTPFYVNTPHPRSEAYRAGIRAFQRGDWVSLNNFMQQVVDNEPDAVDAYYYMGESYRMQGESAQAIEQYNLALQANINFAPALLGRARARIARDPEADVLEELERALSIDPNLAEAHLELARIAIERSDAETALSSLDHAEALLPGSPLVYLLRARAFLIQGDIQQALESARQANELDLTLLETYRVLAEAYQANQQIDDSLEPLEIYTRYISEDARAWVMLGQAYHADQKDDLAMEAFSNALQLNTRLYEAYLQRGFIYLDQGDATQALNDLSTALKLNKESLAASLGLGQAYLALGYRGDAYMQFDRSAPLAQNDSELARVHYWRAVALDALERGEAAEKDWIALLELPVEAVPAEWIEEAQTRLATPTPEPTATLTPSSTPTASSTPTPRPTRAATRTPTKGTQTKSP